MAEAVFPNFSSRLPWEGFLEKVCPMGSIWEDQTQGWQRCRNLGQPWFCLFQLAWPYQSYNIRRWALIDFWRVYWSRLAVCCPKGFSQDILTWYSSRLWGCARLLHLFPLTSKAWPWKVKESELLRKSVSLSSNIPLMFSPWGNFLRRMCTLFVPRYLWGIAINLKFDRELQRMKDCFLRCLWFSWGLINQT
jgi:hypothetical protein